MIRRISIGQFQLKQQVSGEQHLYLKGKSLHPLTERVHKLGIKELNHVDDIAHWVKTFTPNQMTQPTAHLTQYQLAEQQLREIFDILLQLNELKTYINEQIENNQQVQQYNYTSVQHTRDIHTGQATFNLKHFDTLPATRARMVDSVNYGAVIVFRPAVLKYLDMEGASDLGKLYGNYLLAVKL